MLLFVSRLKQMFYFRNKTECNDNTLGYRITRQRERYIRSMLNKLAQKLLF